MPDDKRYDAKPIRVEISTTASFPSEARLIRLARTAPRAARAFRSTKGQERPLNSPLVCPDRLAKNDERSPSFATLNTEGE